MVYAIILKRRSYSTTIIIYILRIYIDYILITILPYMAKRLGRLVHGTSSCTVFLTKIY